MVYVKLPVLNLKIFYKLISITIILIIAIPFIFKDYSSSAANNIISNDKNLSSISDDKPVIRVSDDYLIKVKDIDNKDEVKDKLNNAEDVSTSNEDRSEMDKWIKVKVEDKNDISELKNDSKIETVVKDQPRSLLTTPNDPYYSNTGTSPNGQWNLKNICLGAFGISSPCSSAWESASETGSASTIVAVIDSGIDLTHADLSANIWTNPTPNANSSYPNAIHGWNFADNNNNVQDTHGHGTHVSGIIAASGNNANGIAGVCWSCKIMPLKVINSSGFAYDSDIASAIRYATDNGARIINMSLGGPGYSQILQDAIDYAWSGGNTGSPDLSKSVLIVSAAGNDGASASDSYPGGLLNSLSVGSLDYLNTVASYSNRGYKVDVAAPGDLVLSSYPSNLAGKDYSGCLGSNNNQYCYLSGTSMASPHVAGLAALLLDKHPTWTSRDVRSALIKNTWNYNPTSFDSTGKGYGEINALNTLGASALSTDSVSPQAVLTAPTNNTVNGTWNIGGTASDSNLYLYLITFQRVSNGNITQVSGRSSVSSGTIYSFDTTTLPNDYYNVSMTVEDYAGNTTSSNTLLNVIIDNAAPSSFTLASPSNNSWVNSSKPTLSWNASSSVSPVKYSLNIDSSIIASNITTNSYTLNSSLTEGTHSWYVTAVNSTGISVNSTDTLNIKVDTTLPNDFSVGLTQNNNNVVLNFSTTDALSGLSRYDIVFNNAATVNISSPFSINNLTDGNYTASIYAYDIAGNARIVNKTFSITYRTTFLKAKGDFNSNSTVDLSDLSILAQNYGKNTTTGDINGDGKVDLSDLSILAQNWQKTF